jgi:iron complex transport system substrate-binding protein
MKKLLIALTCVLLIIVIAFAAFFALQHPPAPTSPSNLPVAVVDDLGRTISLSSYPERIVSLAPSCTEILFALGLQNQTVGAVTYSGYTQGVKDWMTASNLTTVGTFSKVNVEAVVTLQPDLVVGTGGYQDSTSQQLTTLGIPVVSLSPTGFTGVLNDIAIVGNVTGKISQQQELIANMNSRAQTIMNQTANLNKTRVYVEYYFTNQGFDSYGSTSYVNDLISLAGGVNVFAGFSGQYVTTSSEEILKANPEVIIISNGAMSSLAGLTPSTVAARPGWNETSAVQNNQIYLIAENTITIGGPSIIDGLEAIAKAIHPELLNSSS